LPQIARPDHVKDSPCIGAYVIEMREVLPIPDASTIEEVFRERSADLWRSVVLYAGDPEVASDAVAEAFAQAIRRGDALESPAAWVTSVAFRIAAGELQRRRRTSYPLVEGAYEMPATALELAEALAQLSPKQRAASILHYRDGYTASEIAELIGSTASAVGVHLFRARKRLRELLGDDDG
jgi:RNA polymerase sigma factor (sigma-70 family)